MRGTQVRGPEIPCRLNSCVRDRCETRRKEEGERRKEGRWRGQSQALESVIREGQRSFSKEKTLFVNTVLFHFANTVLEDKDFGPSTIESLGNAKRIRSGVYFARK